MKSEVQKNWNLKSYLGRIFLIIGIVFVFSLELMWLLVVTPIYIKPDHSKPFVVYARAGLISHGSIGSFLLAVTG